MNRSLSLVFVLISSLGMTAMAQTRHAVPDAPGMGGSHQKVAVILFQAAVARTNEGQRDFANLEKKFAPKKEKLEQESDQINALKKQLQAGAKTLTPDERQEKIDEIQSKEKELSQEAEDANSDFRNQIGMAYNSLAQKLGAVMTAYAKKHGYTLILDASGQDSGVLWASPSTDITKAVIAAYNAKSGVPAPTPSAPKPAVKPGSAK